jgi:hypothetical protein
MGIICIGVAWGYWTKRRGWSFASMLLGAILIWSSIFLLLRLAM